MGEERGRNELLRNILSYLCLIPVSVLKRRLLPRACEAKRIHVNQRTFFGVPLLLTYHLQDTRS